MGNSKSKLGHKAKINETSSNIILDNIKSIVAQKRPPSYDENANRSSLIIQRAFRSSVARLQMREKQAIELLQKLQYANENETAQTLKFCNKLKREINREFVRSIPRETIVMRHRRLAMKMDILENRFKEEYFNTKQLPISFPLTEKEFNKILDCVCRKTDNVLPPNAVCEVMRHAVSNLRRLDNINTITLKKKQQITICGSLNGNLKDLITIFYMNGLPSTQNPYIFNGDLVDRGPNSIEVLVLILACFLTFPNSVYLNRGNHEDSIMNSRYGFTDELQRKYGHFSLKLSILIDEIWRNLPLATIVNKRVLITHGGITSTTCLDFVQTLDRSKYISLLRPTNEAIDHKEWQQILDVIWSSDQASNFTNDTNVEQCAGGCFTEDDTKFFLKKYKLSYLISSNTFVPCGYEYRHSNHLIILSSTSNLFTDTNNSHGSIVVMNHQLKLEFHPVKAQIAENKSEKLSERVIALEQEAINELIIHLYGKYDELQKAFAEYGHKQGFIRMSKWCEALEKVTKLKIPWEQYYDDLTKTEKPTEDSTVDLTESVNVHSTLSTINTESVRFMFKERPTVMDAICKNPRMLEAIFLIIDNERSGYITYNDFSIACDLLEKHIPSVKKGTFFEMYDLMDLEREGYVGIYEFYEIFITCEKYANAIQRLNMDVRY